MTQSPTLIGIAVSKQFIKTHIILFYQIQNVSSDKYGFPYSHRSGYCVNKAQFLLHGLGYVSAL